MMRSLFLQAPSFDGYDGGAGARYQMRREIQSFWYPTWLAQPAALVEGSKLIDAPPHRLKFEDIVPEVKNRDLIVLHTSTPSFASDVCVVEALKAANPRIKAGFVGAKVAVEPQASLQSSPAIDLLFTDVVLPGGTSGRQLADEIVRERPSLPVLFTTGYTRNAIIHHGRLDSNVNLLSKPYTQQDLARKIRQLLQ